MMRDAEYRRLVETLEWARKVFSADQPVDDSALMPPSDRGATVSIADATRPERETLSPAGMRIAAILLFGGGDGPGGMGDD